MDEALLSTLAPPQRLALAYAAKAERERLLTLFALDMRLAGIVRGAQEPVIAQMKLAWWRDRLAEPKAAWPAGEPLLARLAAVPEPAALGPLVDGWEALLADTLDIAVIEAFAAGRSALFAVASGGATGSHAAGRVWALADLAANLGDDTERALVTAQGGDLARLGNLPRPLRILARLGRRGLARGGRPLLEGPGALGTLLRAGLTSR